MTTSKRSLIAPLPALCGSGSGSYTKGGTPQGVVPAGKAPKKKFPKELENNFTTRCATHALAGSCSIFEIEIDRRGGI